MCCPLRTYRTEGKRRSFYSANVQDGSRWQDNMKQVCAFSLGEHSVQHILQNKGIVLQVQTVEKYFLCKMSCLNWKDDTQCAKTDSTEREP